MTSVEIGKIGEKYVVDWLKSKRYIIVKWDTRAPGSTDIEAKHSTAHILVQVKTAVEPNKPADLSSQEIRNLKSRASKIGAIAFQAKVQLDKKRLLKGEIAWAKL